MAEEKAVEFSARAKAVTNQMSFEGNDTDTERVLAVSHNTTAVDRNSPAVAKSDANATDDGESEHDDNHYDAFLKYINDTDTEDNKDKDELKSYKTVQGTPQPQAEEENMKVEVESIAEDKSSFKPIEGIVDTLGIIWANAPPNIKGESLAAIENQGGKEDNNIAENSKRELKEAAVGGANTPYDPLKADARDEHLDTEENLIQSTIETNGGDGNTASMNIDNLPTTPEGRPRGWSKRQDNSWVHTLEPDEVQPVLPQPADPDPDPESESDSDSEPWSEPASESESEMEDPEEAEAIRLEEEARLEEEEARWLKEEEERKVRGEADRLEQERRASVAEEDRLEAKRLRKERLAGESAERMARLDRLEAERLENERIEEEQRLEQERLAAEAAEWLVKLEAERLESERIKEEKRLEQERLAAEEVRQAELERCEKERVEHKRLAEEAEEQARLEAERNNERLAAEEAARQAELERLDQERIEQERVEAEAEAAEQARMEAERLEQERATKLEEQARLEVERLEKEKLAVEDAAKQAELESLENKPMELEANSSAPHTDEVTHPLDQEFLFDDSVVNIQAFGDALAEGSQKVQGWTNQQWIAASGKKLIFTAPVLRVMPGRYFWSSDVLAKRVLAIYNNPDIILIMRLPKDVDEVARLLPIQGGLELSEKELHAFLVVETVADPTTCKIRLSQLTNPTSVSSKDMMQSSDGNGLSNSPKKKSAPRRRCCFDILTPTEIATLSAAFIPDEFLDDIEYMSERALSDTHRCEDAIASALVNSNPLNGLESGVDQAWQHQVVLGTPHSYVISGNNKLMKESIKNALAIQKSRDETGSKGADKVDCIDARDASGKTALHYACSRRRNSILQVLINAGADCSLTLSEDESSPCHICSKSLNETALSIVLSASHPARPNPNALDVHGRTPMYVAAVEGKNNDGNNNAMALDLCLSALEAWGGLWKVDSPKSQELLHPVHIVSRQWWKYEELSVILSHCNYKYPLTSMDGSDPGGISLTAQYHYPIHAALVSLMRKIASAFSDIDNEFNVEFMPLEPALVKTLQTLLNHGFEPNERFEGIIGEGEAIRSLSCYFGFTPLQMLAFAAAEARAINSNKQESAKDGVETTRIMKNIMKVVQASTDLLLKSGARINMPAPPQTRLDRVIPFGCYSLEEALKGETGASMNFVWREQLKPNGRDEILSLLGTADRINTFQNAFLSERRSVENTGALTIRLSSYDSDAPGGSSSYSCAICWSEFGIISNRKHLCRVSCRNVCNDCSRKRLVDNGSELRVADGQFLLAIAEAKKANAKAEAGHKEKMHKQRQSVTQSRKSLGLRSSSSIGSISSKNTETKAKLSTKEKITSAISGLGQTKNAVLERGDKLENLADKTEALNAASIDFAAMAKELNQSQSSWW